MEESRPPKFLIRILRWFCKPDYLIDIEGDVLELYKRRVKKIGRKKANRLLFTDILLLFRPSIIRTPSIPTPLTSIDMFKHNLLISYRNSLKNKGSFLINTLGLSTGIASCLAIMLFVIDELSYDRFHENADQIARVILNAKLGDELIQEPSVPAPVAYTLVQEFPEVLDATRMSKSPGLKKITFKDHTLRKGKMVFVDPNFFDIFTLPLLKGDSRTALSEPNTVVITTEQAQANFGNEDPLNQVIDIEGLGLYTVTGIIDPIPANSHFHFDLFASMKGNEEAKSQNWLQGSLSTYLLLADGVDLTQFEGKLSTIVKKYMGAQLEVGLGMTFEEFLESGNRVGLYLQPLTDIHLHSDFTGPGDFEAGGDIKLVYMFAAIALFMLLIACINFINLSTASASKRVQEIGIRKVLGSRKGQLIRQFLTESFMYALISMGIGILLLGIFLPYFNQLSGKSLTLEHLLSPFILLVLPLLTISISLLAGGYPAFFVSSFQPIQALKNQFTSQGSKGIRSGLVVFQFVISAILIIATLVVGQQMTYIQQKDLGYKRDQLIVIRDAYLLGNEVSAYKNNLNQNPQIQGISNSFYIPAGPTDNNVQNISSTREAKLPQRTNFYLIDEQYIPVMGMEIVAGRNFSREFGADSTHIIINQTTIKVFGLEGDPIGQSLFRATDLEGGRERLTIIGVVKDFHTRSLHEPIEPLIMRLSGQEVAGLIIKSRTEDLPALIAHMENNWTSFESGETFDYAFLDELHNETYLKEQNMLSILRIFAMLTIIVACLGLFGLVTYSAEQRVKEIGIRKVLGSSVQQIVSLLVNDFLKLVLISLLIAFPLGYFFMNEWLQDFAYRVDITIWIFLLAGLLTIGIAFLTIIVRSLQAAYANPVESLRKE